MLQKQSNILRFSLWVTVLVLLIWSVPKYFFINQQYIYLSRFLFNSGKVDKLLDLDLRFGVIQDISANYLNTYIRIINSDYIIWQDPGLTSKLGSRHFLIIILTADRLAQNGDYLLAYKTWQAVDDPLVISRPIYWAGNYTSEGQFSKAFSFYRIAWQMDDLDPVILQRLNEFVCCFPGNKTEATIFLEDWANANLAREKDFLWLGELYLQQANLIKAEKWYKQALLNEPQNQQALMGLAVLYQSSGNLDKLKEIGIQILNRYSEDAKILNYLSVQYLKAGMLPEAYQIANRALDLYPDSADYQNVIAQILALTGDLQQAEEHFVKALTLEPENLSVLINFANFLKNNERRPEAVVYYQKALEQLHSILNYQERNQLKQEIEAQLAGLRQ
jgi:Tfp pilus assembly protein PilF